MAETTGSSQTGMEIRTGQPTAFRRFDISKTSSPGWLILTTRERARPRPFTTTSGHPTVLIWVLPPPSPTLTFTARLLGLLSGARRLEATVSIRISFVSLYALSAIGMSYYNAGQLVLRHPTSYGLNLDFSYTFSNSIDMGSDAERGTEFNDNGGNFSNITKHLEATTESWPLRLRHTSPDHRRLGLSVARRSGKEVFGLGKCRHRCPHRWMAMVWHQPLVQRPALQPS